MIRKLFMPPAHKESSRDSKRNYEIQRIETFSDGVFAFAVTLLIVSLEVPKSFEELQVTVRGFFAFGFSFLILVLIWIEQHRFFRRFGLEDSYTLALNITLLFIVLFYVYPLKFLFSLIFAEQIYGHDHSPFKISLHEVPTLMMIYAGGFVIIYTLFFLMFLHAYRKSAALKLSKEEKFDCQSHMYKELIMVSVGVFSLLVARFGSEQHIALAGYSYMLIPMLITPFYSYRNRLKRKWLHVKKHSPTSADE